MRVVKAAFLALLAVPAFADVITYGCTAGGACNGNEYAVWLVSHTGNTYVMEFDIEVMPTYTGSIIPSDRIFSVALKDFLVGTSYTNLQLIDAPGGEENWLQLDPGELNASHLDGCAAKDNGVERTCTEWQAGPGTAPVLFTTDGVSVGILRWQWQFDSPSELNTTAGIKYLYVNYAGTAKVGSLGSWNIDIQQPVPEPASILLLGIVLVGCGRRLARRWA